MSSALQIAHTDLTGAHKVSAKNAVRPAKRPRDYATQSKAMKMAWESYRKWSADWFKEFGEKLPFRRYQFNKCLRDAYLEIRIFAAAPMSITPEEAQFIGSDCLMKMREAA
ncbi:hypothetical protein FHS77_002695 [Paenochrobactrum gallinarii]|uniref:Uncharacterized protein n=1 Tax=Paenochrobactrum gallinarii TaxID=643673 RepID=A0A841M050_9HYPH|nr:hypothetical protein [Paenochrobactrum gallinarii]MBB6262127.1 hypothetical protein [Paenochrobactrum gallinarii]